MAAYLEGRFTMKRVWVTALSVFTLASMLCGLAPVFWVLVLGRVLQGFAGGMLLPIAIATLFRSFPPNERGLALGFFAIPLVAGPALGPTLGGYLVTYYDWRLVFFINLPIGAAAVLLSLLFLRQDKPRVGLHLDAVGAVLSSLAFGLTLYGLSRVSADGWSSLNVQALIATGAFFLIAFIGWELSQDEPLLEVRLFAIPQFLIANIVGWVSTIALFGAEFMLPLYLQNLRNLSAVETGLLLLPQGLSAAVAGPIGGRLVDRIGARWVVVFGFCLLAFNTWQLSQLTITTSYAELRWLLMIRGLAIGFSLQPTQLVALAVIPDRLRTQASSLNNALRNTVQSFGIAMLSTIVATQSVIRSTTLAWQVRGDTTQGVFLTQASSLLQQRAAMPGGAADATAIALVLAQIRVTASVLAFGDAYHVTFLAALAALALAFLLPGKGGVRNAGPEAMAGGH
jgi:DHA2 family multidrug resistance protein